jgi:hypothetical protein
MSETLPILGCFFLGIVLGKFDLLPQVLVEHDPTLQALWMLMGLTGIVLGRDRRLGEILPLVPKFCFCRLPQLRAHLPVAPSAASFWHTEFLNVWPLAPVSPIIRFRQYSLPGNWAWKSALWPFWPMFSGKY